MNDECFAHTDRSAGGDTTQWEPLFSPGCLALTREHCHECEGLARFHGHLNKVAWWTAKFTSELFTPGSENAEAGWHWGYLAGLWHDLGKFSLEFQRKLHGERIQVEHAGAGAALAREVITKGWEIPAFVIAGHHSGLANACARELSDRLTVLDERLKRAATALVDCRRAVEESDNFSMNAFRAPLNPTQLSWTLGTEPENRFCHVSFVRLLFSALVDADSILTEKFCSPDEKKTILRHQQRYDSLETLRERADSALDRFAANVECTEVNAQRARILEWCREAARCKPGFFTLNVPTGGGKTLASMSFALRHVTAHRHLGMRRVIVAVPYTSIIEQNAGVYRRAMGANNIVEHHSNLDELTRDEEKKENEARDEAAIRRRLACENWDAPVIVTTNVQLFESLFSNKRSRTRKLHNIAGSVIILDEAQCVPVGFLQLILTALRDLVEHYGCTVVLSTATQPAWKYRRSLSYGVRDDQLHPIIPLEADLSHVEAFNRVQIEWPQNDQPLSYEALAPLLASEACVMAIVHRKKDAQWLARKLRELQPEDRLFHLSTNMCPVHRRQVLKRIRAALEDYHRDGTPCRVVSTQLVEAGVDLDFPVIYRALAGLDSIAQAAGRCNRENRLKDRKGRVVVFIAETDPPDGHLKHCAEVTRRMLAEHHGKLDLRDPAVFEEFFVRLYRDRKLDAKDLARHVQDLNFETIGREFRLIDDSEQVPVIIAFDEEARRRIREAEQIATHTDEAVAARYILRALQTYSVDVFPKGLATLRPALNPLFPGSSALQLNSDLYPETYDEVFGLVTDDEPQIAPDRLIL